MTLIYYIYPRVMTEVNVSATVGMSATVEEMSATVGKLNMIYEIQEGRLSFITLHRLPMKIHEITCKKPIRI